MYTSVLHVSDKHLHECVLDKNILCTLYMMFWVVQLQDYIDKTTLCTVHCTESLIWELAFEPNVAQVNHSYARRLSTLGLKVRFFSIKEDPLNLESQRIIPRFLSYRRTHKHTNRRTEITTSYIKILYIRLNQKQSRLKMFFSFSWLIHS